MTKCRNLNVWLLSFSICLSSSFAFAQTERTLEVKTPGTLPTLIGESDKNTITKLTLTGSLDGTDILFIREMAGGAYYSWERNEEGKLSELDLSGAKIVSGGAAYSNVDDLYDCYTADNTVSDWMFYNCDKLTKLHLPNSATSIGRYAIYDMDKLTDLDFGTGISEIGEFAVSYNDSLRQLVVPEQVVSLGSGAFAYNNALKSLKFGNRIEELPDACFEGCDSLQEVVLPSQLKRIGSQAFYYCKLKEIKLPTTVTTVGDYAFSHCPLTEVNLHECITELGRGAFSDCYQLAKVHLPNSLTTISDNTFYECRVLTDINLCETLTTIGGYAFYNTGLEKVKLPSKVEQLEYYTFAHCQNLREIDLGTTVTYIGEWALANTALTSIKIPAQVETIDSYALFDNKSLESVSIANGVKSIGEYVFMDCSNIKSIVLPASVENLGESIFFNCTGLESAEIKCSITDLPDYLFSGCSSLQTIIIPQDLQGIGSGAFDRCTSLPAFAIPPSVTELGSSAFENCTSLKEITIPQGVTTLGYYTFRGCTNLQTINLPEKLKRLGDGVFSDCIALKSIRIPDSVEVIGNNAFYNCQALESINWPEKVTDISYSTFINCTSLKNIALPETITSIGNSAFEGSGLTAFIVPPLVTALAQSIFSSCVNLESITLPDGLQTIDNWCFSRCQSLKSITIPANVTSIGYRVFSECPALTEIHARPQETPQAESAFYELDQQNCTLYVPEGCILAYQSAEGWKDFANIVEEGVATDTTPLVAAEWTVLKLFFNQTGGASWTRGWVFGDSPATTKTLTGVTSRNGHVVRITLPNNNLSGQLGHELLTLPQLAELDLSGNQLSGNLSTTLVSWLTGKSQKEVAPISYLDISGNPFTGNLGLLAEALASLTTLKAADCHFSEVQPALPERISTVDIKRQTLEGEIEYNQLINGETLDERVPSIMRYDPKNRTYDESFDLRLTDELTNQRTWDVLLSMSDGYSYNWWSQVYRRENGLLLYALSENDQEHMMRVRFNFMPGDVNFDTVLDIADLQRIINNALYNDNGLFNHTAANLVADDTINVQDVVAEINLLLAQDIPTQANARRISTSNIHKSTFENALVYIEDGQLILDSPEPVAAFSITLPADGFEWLQPIPNILCATKPHEEKLRVIGYSLSGGNIPAGRTVLAKVNAQYVTNAELVETNATRINAICNMTPMGIASANSGIDITTGHREITLNVQNPATHVSWTVYTLSGQAVAQGIYEELPAGQTTIAIPVAGQFMVKVTGPNLNIIKKVFVK